MSDDQSLDEVIELIKEYLENFLEAQEQFDDAKTSLDIVREDLFEMRDVLQGKLGEEKDRTEKILQEIHDACDCS